MAGFLGPIPPTSHFNQQIARKSLRPKFDCHSGIVVEMVELVLAAIKECNIAESNVRISDILTQAL